MEFQIIREKLLALSEVADSIVERRNSIPILSNMLLRVKDGKLVIMSTDLDLLVQAEENEIEVIAEGSTTISSDMLRSIIQKVPAHGNVSIKVASGWAEIKSGRSTFKLPVLPAEDFPDISRSADGNRFSIGANALQQAMKRVQASVSTEETRHYLNGVCLDPIEFEGNGQLRLVSTDGHRLTVTHIEPANCQIASDTKIIIPRKAVREIIKMAGAVDADVEIEYNTHRISVKAGSTILISKLVDGTFPDYERIIPPLSDKPVVINADAFKRALDRVTVISSERTRSVSVDINSEKQGIEVKVNDVNTGQASEEIGATVAQALKIGFNSKYLTDYLDHDGDITLHLTTEAAPARISFSDFPQDIAVLMPQRL